MGTRWAAAWTVAAVAACGGEGAGHTTGAWEPGSSDDDDGGVGKTASVTEPGDADASASADDSDGGKTASATDPGTTDPGDETSTDPGTSGSATSGEPYDCATIGYTGLCDGDVLVWCENDEIMMVDCAQQGEVCAFQSDRIGYNCLPAGGGSFGYPVGDTTTWPAGGWTVTQVLGHYLNFGSFVGAHLASRMARRPPRTRRCTPSLTAPCSTRGRTRARTSTSCSSSTDIRTAARSARSTATSAA